MKSVALNAYPRALIKRTGLKKVRSNDRVPAVIYGRHAPPQNLEVKWKDLDDMIHHAASENVLVDLAVDGDARPKRLALVQDVQHHPLSGKVLHVDFHEVTETEKVTIWVPIETAGEPVGVKTGGGVLEHVLFRLKVKGLTKDLPESITLDVTKLETGKAIHIGDIAVPAGVEILGEKKIVVVSVALAKTEAEEAAETAAATSAQPEMIKEKKEEGAAGGEKEKAAEKGEKKKEPEKAKKEAEKPEKKK